MPKDATETMVEVKTRRDKKYFVIKNGRNKRIRFAKPFTSVPVVHAEGTDANGIVHLASVKSVSVSSARVRFPHKSTWIAWWEATPVGDLGGD